MFERPSGGERAVLVYQKTDRGDLATEMGEFRELAISAGAEVLTDVKSSRITPDPKLFLGKGKVEELSELIKAEQAELILINHELSPSQERNLERALQCRVLDRTGLILDIFAQRARTYEGKLQVELAQLRYLATRLVRGWTHLERQKGGIGLRGPGETQLEVDRRLIRKRIDTLTKRLEKVRRQREQSRSRRKRVSIPTVALVGYTNTGKSTLFNKLTKSDVLVKNQLFATLDPTLRVMWMEGLGKVILADTVGFVRDLPHDLVEAFRATLEETREADLLLHVIDCQDVSRHEHIRQVEAVLDQIDALDVPRLEVYNKIDLAEGVAPGFEPGTEGSPSRVWISALSKIGLDSLREAIGHALLTTRKDEQMTLPWSHYDENHHTDGLE